MACDDRSGAPAASPRIVASAFVTKVMLIDCHSDASDGMHWHDHGPAAHSDSCRGPPEGLAIRIRYFDRCLNAEVFGVDLLVAKPAPAEATDLLEPRQEIPQAI
eukprot:COSAG02_NODE_180_length_31057_cov_21.869501_14_plen_104_part_00